MSPTLNLVLNHVERLEAYDLQVLERAVQARRRLLANRKPRAGSVPAKTASAELDHQGRIFESIWAE